MCRSPSRLLAGVLAGLLWANLAHALPGDKELPIRIEADSALRDENKGITQYEGNVKLDQGSLHIEADRLIIQHQADDARKIEAYGRPAIMRQQPDVDKGVITARGLTIEYFREEERVLLTDEASVEQDGSIARGDVIDYDIPNKLIQVGPKQGDNGSRVHVIIPAQTAQQVQDNQKQDKQAQDAAPDPNQVADPNAPLPAAQAQAEAADGATEGQ
ncbi:lipopolysaccharide transport periplasmic protein LptA [Mangrovimicrobium sediminis]|uniref:Lipopolysaccharide export system protein LptA n=1 Tax=Mangrovimicrobium sediminis TaxID=2562682 RepID=A0A4Z0LYE9_9GAMM|nr:lipopolysaccharide transport periplasmic protein LptA [Haliea sp. SAOS-164]TGD72105.1 lipopolysaccharide transport periplasmic protein LptA [Haliea sp. SAOS-164]